MSSHWAGVVPPETQNSGLIPNMLHSTSRVVVIYTRERCSIVSKHTLMHLNLEIHPELKQECHIALLKSVYWYTDCQWFTKVEIIR